MQQPNSLDSLAAARRSLKSYEVTIEGIGKKPYVDAFDAPSPGLAKLAAQDKFGKWIRVIEVKERQKKLKLTRTVPEKRRRSRAKSKSVEQPLNIRSPWT